MSQTTISPEAPQIPRRAWWEIPEERERRRKLLARLERSRGCRQLAAIGEAANELLGLLAEFLRDHDVRRESGRGCGCHFCRFIGNPPEDVYAGPGIGGIFDELRCMMINVNNALNWTVEQVPGA